MGRRTSVISQLLVGSCVVAVLIGTAAAIGYISVTRQDAAARQATGHYWGLLEADHQVAEALDAAHSSVLYAVARDQRGDRRSLGPAEADFAANLATLQHDATAGLPGLVAAQARAGTAWFTLAHKIVTAGPGSPAARALLGRSESLDQSFEDAHAATEMRLTNAITGLTTSSKQALGTGLAWSAAALGVAVLLVLASSVSTLSTITRPLRSLTATVRRLTSGDHHARATVTGSAEVRQVAQAVNSLADESDRLRAQEAESIRLRAMAREAGLRIREHLVAEEVLHEAQTALEQNIHADVTYLRLLEGDHLGPVVGHEPGWFPPGSATSEHVAPVAVDVLHNLFRSQASMVVQDMRNEDGDKIPPGILAELRRAGVVSHLLTPFGAASSLLGVIIAQRLHPGRPWTRAEVDAVESIAADLGRGLNQARLYEAENRLVEDLQGLDRAKSDLFATVSHELRAPLTTIEGYVEMLDEGEGGQITPQGRQMLATIDRSTVRLRNLIDDLFTLAKLESATFTTVMRPVNLAEVINGAAAAMRPSVEDKHLSFTVTGTEYNLVVDGDTGQLERALINLLSNAIKFTPDEGRIEVTADTEGSSAVIRITDTGIGIPERDQKEMFSRFFRASNATQRSIPGTGLGLAIVRTIIVNNHGGEIDIHSLEGTGTTVTIQIPLLPPAP
jgi:two-component system phosphate regulon sensor histidine kinase PhoR